MSAVIFDLGGETAKIGLSTEDVPGLLACTKHHEGAFFSNGVDMSSQQKLELYGWKHCWKDGVASFIDEPGFEDGGGMESLIRYGYQERGVDPEGSTAHICIPPHVINIGEEAGDDHLENFGELFFEKLGVDTLSIADKCMMCLVGTGKTSGIVVEVGADMTFVNSYVEGGTNEIIAGPWNVSLNLGGTVQTLMMTKLHHGDLSDYVTGIDTGGGAGRTFSGIPNTLMAHFKVRVPFCLFCPELHLCDAQFCSGPLAPPHAIRSPYSHLLLPCCRGPCSLSCFFSFVKHTHGYCELDADAILARHQTASYDEKGAGTCSADCPKETYTMPDGQEVHIDYPLFIGGEVLFYPEITGDRFSEDTQPITIGNVMGDGDGKGERFCDYVCEGECCVHNMQQ